MRQVMGKSKTVVILQSSYIPWKGYFDLIRMADQFILYDDVQFTKRDWRNRNRIKTSSGLQWLTIPVLTRGRFTQKISECTVSDSGWAASHWKAISMAYARAEHFRPLKAIFENAYMTLKETSLSQINYHFIKIICSFLKIETPLRWSMDYSSITGVKTERLVSLCRAAGATRYLSGPSAKDYIEPALFKAAGIDLDYMTYEGYPEYRQLFGPFEHHVSILDLLFNEGPEAIRFMKGF